MVRIESRIWLITMPLTILLKQRLVGAFVLIALAVIFVPMFLEGPSQQLMPAMEKMPEPEQRNATQKPPPFPRNKALQDEPEKSVLTIQTAKKTLVIPPENVETITPPSTPLPTPPALEKKTKAEKTNPQESWVIQVGSFASEKNALALRNKLRKSGLATQVEKVSVSEGKRYRVRVGPYLERTQANTVNARLGKDFSLTGARVMSYP